MYLVVQKIFQEWGNWMVLGVDVLEWEMVVLIVQYTGGKRELRSQC